MASNLKQIRNKYETKITVMYFFLKIRQTYTCMTVYSEKKILKGILKLISYIIKIEHHFQTVYLI